MFTKIKLRGGTAAQWLADDDVLLEREVGLDLTNNEIRIGNGIDPWSILVPISSISYISSLLDVDITTDPPATNDVLAWDSVAGKWTPAGFDFISNNGTTMVPSPAVMGAVGQVLAILTTSPLTTQWVDAGIEPPLPPGALLGNGGAPLTGNGGQVLTA